MVVEIATLSYLWGAAPGCPRGCVTSIISRCMPRAGLRRSFLLGLGSKFLGGVLLDKMRPEQAPMLFVAGGAMTALSVVALMLSHQPAWLALFMLSANVFWGLQGAAIPAVIQHHAAREAVGSAYGIINGIGNICAAFIPLLMGMVMRSVGSVSSGFSVLVVSQVVTLLAGECCCCACGAQQQSARKAYSPFSPPGYRAFPAPGRRGQRGDLGLVIGRSHFHHVHPDDVQILQAAHQLDGAV